MKKIQKLLIWYWLLHKRLWKTPGFLIVMCAVPCLTAAFRISAREERGVMTIAVYASEPQGKAAAEILDSLRQEQGILRYLFPESEEQARKAVGDGSADMAWIFMSNLEELIINAAESGSMAPMAAVIVQEDNTLLTFAREKLYSVLYSYFSEAVYDDYMKNVVGQGKMVSGEEIQEVYQEMRAEGNLFREVHLDGTQTVEEETNYLMTPVRGLLALWLILCGLAASMYFMQDEENAVLSRIPVHRRIFFAWAFHLAVLLDALVIMLTALWSAGLFTNLFREVCIGLMLVFSAVAFCNIVRLLCRKKERLGIFIPILLILMMILCPVFVSAKGQRILPVYLMPPYYYLYSVYDNVKLFFFACYTVSAYILCFLLDCKKEI